ncbi:MAG: ATP-binding protein [Campylobacterota bacterium]|nr:ATP-binding protein [Campylobacterota bacterium]
MLKYSNLSKQLLKSILLIYFIITVIITLIHFVIEYNYTKTNINQELKTIAKTFKTPLNEALWELDNNQVVNIGKGIYNIPLVYGVLIEDQSTMTLSKILHENLKQQDIEDQQLIYSFDLSYHFNDIETYLGKVTLYSSNSAVFDRIKVGFSMILLNAMIKSAVLIILFIITFNKYLKIPLKKLTDTINNMKLDGNKSRELNIKFEEQNELSILQDNFNELLKKISQTEYDKLNMVKNLNTELEQKVQQRTHDLKEQKDKFEAIYKTSKDGIAILDIVTTQFLDANPAYSEITGYTKEELLNTTCLELTLEKDKIRSQEALREVEKKGFIKDFTKTCIAKSGKLIVTNMTISLMNDKKRVLVTVKDITKQKELENSLIEEKNNAQESTKLKSVFLANMSHEIRTPMNGILGMSHLAIESTNPLKQKEYIKKIDENAKSLLSIINDILDFSKIEAGKLNIENINFNINSVITNLKNIVELKAYEKDLKLNIFYNNEKNNIYYGDPIRIGQVLVNLVNNAIKFTHKGSIDVVIEDMPNDIVRFKIKDTGIGIAQKDQERLFQSFSQADGSTTREYGGTGLGLSISKQLVELMDGTISVESEVDKGSEFTFEIFLPSGSKVDASLNNVDSLKTLQSSITTVTRSNILLVEDNITNKEIIHSLLETANTNIDDAFDGVMAIEMYNKAPSKYDLIIMDIQMPIMDGYEATREIRKKDKNIPIIALTANAMASDIEASKKAGMNDHLNKPIDIEQLYSVLLKYLPFDYKKKETVDDENIKSDNLDVKKALIHMGGNKKLYKKVLLAFYKDYHGLKLNNLKEEELKRIVHTIKGLSGNIGANKLHNLAKDIDKTQDMSLLSKMQEELEKVCDELKYISEETDQKDDKKEDLAQEKKDQLFLKLKETILSKRPKNIRAVVDQIEPYKLEEEDKLIFEELKALITKYKFDEAYKKLESYLSIS